MCRLMLKTLVRLLQRMKFRRSQAREEKNRLIPGDLAATPSTIPTWLNQLEQSMTLASNNIMGGCTPLTGPDTMVLCGSSSNLDDGSRVQQATAGTSTGTCAGSRNQNGLVDPAMREK